MHLLNAFAENFGGIEVKRRYSELFKPAKTPKADDIIYDITSRLNGTYNELI